MLALCKRALQERTASRETRGFEGGRARVLQPKSHPHAPRPGKVVRGLQPEAIVRAQADQDVQQRHEVAAFVAVTGDPRV